MKNEVTMSYINLHAVLRNIQDLCRLDDTSKDMIQGVHEIITFKIKGGGSGTLIFEDGQCTMTRKKVKSTITLLFTSCHHFNEMIDSKAKPIPIKGLTRIGFLTGIFTQLTDRLETYLRPTPELLEDDSFRYIHTELTLYTAAFALAEIGNHDYIGKKIASAIPDGIISMEIMGGPALSIVAKDGTLTVVQRKAKEPRSRMDFADMSSAYDLLSGDVDSYTCIASEKLLLSGYIPMLDNLDKLLFQVSAYLK